ncbi:MAG: hypothetical protein AB1427_01850 [Thermodesulfobacteriota bacterium]
MENGRYVKPHPPLQAIREKFEREFSRLPEDIKSIFEHNPYSVNMSKRVQKTQEKLA